MEKRFVSIWFRHLATDWFSLSQPDLKNKPFVLRTSQHGRMVITAANAVAEQKGISCGMVLADARAIFPEIIVMDDKPDLPSKLLYKLAEWCIRFTPVVSIDLPNGLFFDATGCAHLWGGEGRYLADILKRLSARGYDVRVAMAETATVAWGVARYGKEQFIIEKGKHIEALLPLPPEALRLESENVRRLHRLGLCKIGQFIQMPRTSLRRRFGQQFLTHIDRAIGQAIEVIQPIYPIEAYQERLPCMEPILTAQGIEIALTELLKVLCHRLQQEQKGLRSAIFKSYRVDGRVLQVDVATNRPTHHVQHIFKLFENKLTTIEPDLGIELFILEAPKVEEHFSHQEKIWEGKGGLEDERVSELIDRLANKIGTQAIKRYLPEEHYWPERSLKIGSFQDQPTSAWPDDKLRPLHLLPFPEPIEVTSLIPDYPPILFLHNGKRHEIAKADGPERIEQEWWLQQGQHRDYYRVEDNEGFRYWIFRLGHYDDTSFQWFLHGFFA
jgi:protein ImuB